MTCACCRLPATAFITWISEPRDDGSAAIKLALCLKCSEQVKQEEFSRRLTGIPEYATGVDIRTPYLGISRSDWPKRK